MEQLKKMVKSNLLYLLGGVIGAVAGYIYYVNVGCESGSCPITSSAWSSVIWGAVMGGLVFSLFKKKPKKDE